MFCHVTIASAGKDSSLPTIIANENRTPAGRLQGETRELEFLAGNPGTYPYWGTTSDSSLAGRRGEETLLSGALVIDPPGVKAEDRIFALGVWEKAEKLGLD